MKFNYTAVESYCEDLNGILNRMENIYEDCQNQINSIKNRDLWTGVAADSFVNKSKNTMEIYNTMLNNLKNIIEYIRLCADNYEKTEKKIIEEITGKLQIK